MKKIFLLLYFIPSIIHAQYSNNFDRINEVEEIVYYGFDFSFFRLTNSEKLGTETEVTKFFGAWISYFETESDYLYQLEKNLKKKTIKSTDSIQIRYNLLPKNWIVFDENVLKLDEIKNIVKTYSLKESSGIGLVAIVENFNKGEEMSRICWVFFDINSREVYWAGVAKGFASKPTGMTRHWGSSMVESFINFQNLYKKERKKHK